MSQSVGTFVYGDSGSALRYTILQDGAAFDVTGSTSIVMNMVRMASGSDVTDTITGAIYGTADGTFEFTPIGSVVAQPANRADPHVYECRISFVKSTKTYWTEAFRITVVRFP